MPDLGSLSKFLSIIVPVYNVREYIRDCIGSVLVQDEDDFELLIVDDGSSDGSMAIVNDLLGSVGSRISFKILSQPHGGPSMARNAGLRAASSRYVMFLDSDDTLFDKNTIGKIKGELSTESLDMLHYNFVYMKNGAEQIGRKIVGGFTGSGMQCFRFLYRKGVYQPMVWMNAIRRSFLLERRLSFRKGIVHEDALLMPLIFMEAERVKIIDDVLYRYRIRSGSIMTNERTGGRIRSMNVVIGTLASQLPKSKDEIFKDNINRYLAFNVKRILAYRPFKPGFMLDLLRRLAKGIMERRAKTGRFAFSGYLPALFMLGGAMIRGSRWRKTPSRLFKPFFWRMGKPDH